MTLQLVFPEKKWLPSVYAAVEEYQSSPSLFQTENVKRMIEASKNNFSLYFQKITDESIGKNLKEGYVPQTVFWLVDNEKYIGSFCLRHRLTPNLEKIGGHIAYQIRPSEQRKGYGSAGLKLCLAKACEMGIEEVLITCNAENIASYALMHKIMLEYGGIEAPAIEINDIIEKRVWIHTQKRYGKIRPLAIAVIKRGNRVLAVAGYDELKKEKFYRLPGGGIEFGETSKQALEREINEEIGLNVIVGKKLGVFENIFTYNGQKGHEIIIAYEAKLEPEYMQTDKFKMIEKEFENCCYEFVDITPSNIIYPKILDTL